LKSTRSAIDEQFYARAQVEAGLNNVTDCYFRSGRCLKIMFVGGPNVRDDYHMDQGEEVRKNYCYTKTYLFFILLHTKRLQFK